MNIADFNVFVNALENRQWEIVACVLGLTEGDVERVDATLDLIQELMYDTDGFAIKEQAERRAMALLSLFNLTEVANIYMGVQEL